jgi:hypothetical protein
MGLFGSVDMRQNTCEEKALLTSSPFDLVHKFRFAQNSNENEITNLYKELVTVLGVIKLVSSLGYLSIYGNIVPQMILIYLR